MTYSNENKNLMKENINGMRRMRKYETNKTQEVHDVKIKEVEPY